MTDPIFRLREQSFGFRAGATFLVLTLFIGLATSFGHLVSHHENRDEKPGLSMEDITGAYHGVKVIAPLITALERGHPETLGDSERTLLMDWLASETISDDYDNLDKGDSAPAEILDGACLNCHARQATEGDGIGERIPLEYWDDVRAVAFSREVEPVDEKILMASSHTHALTMGALSFVVALLALATRFSRGFIGFMVFANGLALFTDLACWWLARDTALFVPILAVAGGVWMATTALQLGLVLGDLWLPHRAE